jgi:hypothetical protein
MLVIDQIEIIVRMKSFVDMFLFQMIREKITNFLATSSCSPRITGLLTSLVQALLTSHPHETLKYLLPQTCERLLHQAESSVLTDHKGDDEFTWHLILFSELLRARGNTLLEYKSLIIDIFHRCIHVIHKPSYQALAKAARNLLKSLSYVYVIDYRLNTENIDEPMINCLPIRVDRTYLFDNRHANICLSRHGVNMFRTIDSMCNFTCPIVMKSILLVNSSMCFSMVNYIVLTSNV